MGEIRFVGTGETRGYPYPVCKKKVSLVVIGTVGVRSLLYLWHSSCEAEPIPRHLLFKSTVSSFLRCHKNYDKRVKPKSSVHFVGTEGK